MLREWIYQIHEPILLDNYLILQLLPETKKQIRNTTLPDTKDKSEILR